MRGREVAVYRAYDARGALLYVGISRNWGARWAVHARASTFFRFVARLDVEMLADRAAALQREAELIRTLQPPFNRHHRAPGEVELHCDRCACWYSGLEWSGKYAGARCDDWAQGPEAPCPGTLWPAA